MKLQAMASNLNEWECNEQLFRKAPDLAMEVIYKVVF